MYIKKIVIEGFKSFRDLTIVDSFDKGHNVVLGRNGSGKSNLFSAIELVFREEYARLNPQQRQSLLHGGTSIKVLMAFVEIVFDNSDGKIPIGNEEIIIRRVLGIKKDQYFLNQKVVPRSEIMSLLEVAGFPRLNSYHIVQQRKVSELALASDFQRLELLREVAGSRVYEEQHTEIMTQFRESQGKLDVVGQILSTIDENLSTLNKEKEALEEYEQYNRIKTVLEYIIYNTELNGAKKKLAELSKVREESGSKQKRLVAVLEGARENIKSSSKQIKDLNKELAELEEERNILRNDNQHLIQERTKLDFIIKDLSKKHRGDVKIKEFAENELERLNKVIAKNQAELEKIKPLYEWEKAKELQCTRQLALKEQNRKDLYAKQARGKFFESKKDRNKWIQNELELLNGQIKAKRDHQGRLEAEVKRDTAKIIELQIKLERESKKAEQQKKNVDDYKEQYNHLKKKKEELQTGKNELWRKETRMQDNLFSLKEDLVKQDQQLRSVVGPTLTGLDSVQKVLDTFIAKGGPEADIIKGYYGPLIKNFECIETMYMAVEVTAGNRLFYHVIENDKIATLILKEMNNQNLRGEVSFMPLNRLNISEQVYPNDDVAIPILSKLRYDQKFHKAMKYIFGKTLVCRSLEVATKYARSTGLDCVTLDGDRVSSKGCLTGGYIDKNRSRLKMYKHRAEINAQINFFEQELIKLQSELRSIESQSNKLLYNMQEIETKINNAEESYETINVNLILIKEELSNTEKLRVSKERSLEQFKCTVEAMQATKKNLESEMEQELLMSSVADKEQIDMLNNDILRLQDDIKKHVNARIKLEVEKSKLETLLTNNLIRSRDEVLHTLQNCSLEDSQRQLINCESELQEYDKTIDMRNEKLQNMEEKVEAICQNMKLKQNELDNRKRKLKDAQDHIDEDVKCLEKLASKQNLLEAKMQETVQKIKQLPPLPSEELYRDYVKMSSKVLFKELNKINERLKSLCCINKRAISMYKNLSDKRENLHKRMDELRKGEDKIKSLFEVLEQRKVAAIHFTYNQVSKHFSDVFKQLVPLGKGKLLLNTRNGDESGTSVDTDADNLKGVAVHVTFTTTDADMEPINQLSGGQKTLVALALIFAIQKCDPAPFYLFDEIDGALHTPQRIAVAKMIQEFSKDAQFITTTFRPEFLDYASKFYGVKLRNQVSHVESITKDIAKNFVEDTLVHN